MTQYAAICSRIDAELRHRLKLHCITRRIRVQDVVALCITQYLDKYEKEIEKYRK